MKEWIIEKYEKVDWSKVKSLDQSVLSPIKKFALENGKIVLECVEIMLRVHGVN